ncbi:MAG: thermonuclease family protein [Chloroflexi bacterium]|nr:thermonuclease family protein [Chloroflexota bacterium]MDA1270727.1 thermonuclease family protein [Chloroflexota bacterium]
MILIVKLLFVALAVSLLAGCATSRTISGALDSEATNNIEVVRIIDGDTLDVLISGVPHRVRLFGVDTPEWGEPCYQEASDRLRQLAGDVARIEAGPRAEDTYGRLLFYLYTLDGESIDATLISEGLAKARTGDGQYRDLLVNLEEEARTQGVGCLW